MNIRTRSRRATIPSESSKEVRCAVYARKSSDEGLELAFNSLEAQRDSAEEYIRSQRHEGWIALPTVYEDGGYSGGTMDRPALTQLLRDVESGGIDAVVVYRADRLSRSLVQFGSIMEMFEKHGCAFVSVTEHFNTDTPGGRMHLNMMMMFAQYERELASERTRHKIAAARKKGKYAGGAPVLGFDIVSESSGSRLVINTDEAEQVRRIFSLYLELGSLIPVVERLAELGWTTKRWITRKGTERGGAAIDKTRLHAMLTNVLYVGKVRHHDHVYEGEHDAIITPELWKRVQQRLASNARTGGAEIRNKYGAILKGLVRCAHCNCAMIHTHSKKGNRQYRYYTCTAAQKRGVKACPTRSVSAPELEAFVVNEIKGIGRDPALVAEVIDAANRRIRERRQEISSDQRVVKLELKRLRRDMRTATDPSHQSLLHDRIEGCEQRVKALTVEGDERQGQFIEPNEVREALAEFDTVWSMLSPREQCRVMHLLIDHVSVDRQSGKIAISFKPTGLRGLGMNDSDVEAA